MKKKIVSKNRSLYTALGDTLEQLDTFTRSLRKSTALGKVWPISKKPTRETRST